MSKELTKKAVEMLLKGATLISDPCPYCKGVRIMKDGNAFGVNCGKEGKEEKLVSIEYDEKKKENSSVDKLEAKLKELTDDLQREKNYEKQQQILRSINDILSVKEKLKKF